MTTLLIAALSLSTPTFKFASRTEQVIPLPRSPITIEISATNGHVRVQYGRANQVVVKTLVRGTTVEQLSETSLTTHRAAQSLVLTQVDHFKPAPDNGKYQNYQPPILDLTVSVPHDANLKINTTNADIRVEGVAGSADIKSFNGAIDYQAQVDSPRPITTSVRNGKVTSADIPTKPLTNPPIRLETYNGDIRISTTEPPKLLKNARFFTGRGFRPTNWYIVDGLLTKRKPDVPFETIDLTGKFVAPAYGDAHTHHFEGEYFSRRMASQYLSEGTVFAQTMTEHISMKADANRVVNRPDSLDVAFADAGITATNGHPTFTYEALAANLPANLTPQERSDQMKTRHTQEGDAYWIVDTPQELDAVWPRFLASDPDLLKIFLVDTAKRDRNEDGFMGSIGLDPKLIPLIVQRAHASGLRVYAHIDTALDFQIALESGVDGLAHVPGYGFNEGSPDLVKITPRLAKLAAKRYVQLTAGLASGYAGKNLARTQQLQAENIRQLRRAGAIPVVGSDSYGSTTVGEVQAWRKLGQTALQILTALSRDTPQSIFPNRTIGKIAEGFEANLVVLPMNPLNDSALLLAPEMVLKKGRVVFPKVAPTTTKN